MPIILMSGLFSKLPENPPAGLKTRCICLAQLETTDNEPEFKKFISQPRKNDKRNVVCAIMGWEGPCPECGEKVTFPCDAQVIARLNGHREDNAQFRKPIK